MTDQKNQSAHNFYIPVMGTGFTIDTPLRVAPYGISSVISLVDDQLIEQMRKHHCQKAREPYEEIRKGDDDFRARRITTYLNLIDRLVQQKVQTLQSSPFETDSEITKYFEMLPESNLKKEYSKMLEASDLQKKAQMQEELRRRATPGSIDVNIMTKLNNDEYQNGQKLPPEYAHGLAALRGYAKSTLHSSIIFSAGINQRLYAYIKEFDDFFPDENNGLKKKIILKVSDYRSALLQGKFLAKKGLWVSEYRIESGLNCGGHAFATKGFLIGPILEQFKQKRQELLETQYSMFKKSLEIQGRPVNDAPPEMTITMQGGIGTHDENTLLFKQYSVNGVGWGTPFMLVPEVTNVDEEHLKKLSQAGNDDVYLSDSSPLNIPFWNLRTSASEEARRQRIEENQMGSSCPKGFLKFNSEMTNTPICTASRVYQKRKLREIAEGEVSKDKLTLIKESILNKSCICHDLAGCATRMNELDPKATPAVCCGPNIVNFSKICTLKEMVDHIYGRISILTNPKRSHMFIKELRLYVDYLCNEMKKRELGLSDSSAKYFSEFKDHLLEGIEYYQDLSNQVKEKYRVL
ncbi:MAG: hypothetical protein K940chlam7_01820, partial [Chlamydiae bacterium]|nr:hypothetical protein [Chlamydiota bacterium]